MVELNGGWSKSWYTPVWTPGPVTSRITSGHHSLYHSPPKPCPKMVVSLEQPIDDLERKSITTEVSDRFSYFFPPYVTTEAPLQAPAKFGGDQTTGVDANPGYTDKQTDKQTDRQT